MSYTDMISSGGMDPRTQAAPTLDTEFKPLRKFRDITYQVFERAKPVPDEVRKDAERIDFLQSVARCDPKMDGNHVWWPLDWNTCQTIKGPNLREAIDAAIAAQGGQG